MKAGSADLSHIQALYDRGKLLQAYQLGQSLGTFDNWPGTDGRILAGRLAATLNAPRTSWRLHLTSWRADRAHPHARYFHARALLERFGLHTAGKFIRQFTDRGALSPEQQAEWLGLEACIMADLRDFENAHRLIERAIVLAPQHPWIHVERSHVLEKEDRYEEALAAALDALQYQPSLRAGLQAAAHLLQLQERNAEARQLLADAAEQLESFHIFAQLAELHFEMGDMAAARETYERLATVFPELEPKSWRGVHARRAHLAYLCEDFPAALELASQLEDPFFTHLRETLSNGKPAGRRHQLPVGFVRQHHLTCAPATLSAISHYWKVPADHLDIAEEICYDGTPPARERQWAEQNGWTAREFTVTWEAAVAILDRGIPFTLTTVEPSSAHLQAVIGYDSRYRSLLIRDPFARNYGEFTIDRFLERYRSTGPRGMVLVPNDQVHLLGSLDLPDTDLYDDIYQLQLALLAHDRDRARDLYKVMRRRDKDHRLTLTARRLIAAYDGNESGLLKSTERLLAFYPNDPVVQSAKIQSLRQLDRREARLEILRELTSKPGLDPIFRLQYAQELMSDARQHAEVASLLRRLLRRYPLFSRPYALSAELCVGSQRWNESLALHRIAACLDEKDEQAAWSYFRASRLAGVPDEGLRFLRGRVDRLGRQSSQPVLTLFAACRDLDRMSDGYAALDGALATHPDDGDLLLGAADFFAAAGNTQRATKLLGEAAGKSRWLGWRRAAATVARARGELGQALQHWNEILARDPLSIEAHRAATQLIAETASRGAAIEQLARTARRFPHHFGLHRLWAEWTQDEEPAQREAVLRQLVKIDPFDAWTRRELALCLCRQHRHLEAQEEADVATNIDPHNSTSHSVRGWIAEEQGHFDEAYKKYRLAIHLNVDDQFAMRKCVALSESTARRREVLDELRAEIERQVNFGEGLICFAELARGVCEPKELLSVLREALRARPDLPQAWLAVIRQLVALGEFDEALKLADEACQAFPLHPPVWQQLADVHRNRNDLAGQLAALERARDINPQWSHSTRRLSEAYEAAGDMVRARRLLDQAIARQPLEAENHAALGLFFWRQNLPDAALETLTRAVELDSNSELGWANLKACAAAYGRDDYAVEQARKLTQTRAGEARSWLTLAQLLTGPEHFNEQLAAADRAIALDPRCAEGFEVKAAMLADNGRFDEALAACRPAAWGDRPPLFLRGREAWIYSLRGDLPRAVELMREIVNEDRQYGWGWHNLIFWHDARGEHQLCAQAAEELARISPQNITALDLLSKARERNGDRAGATEPLRRLLALDPTNAQALARLIELHLSGGNHVAAENELKSLAGLADPALLQAQRMVIAARLGRNEEGCAALAELCRLPGENLVAWQTAVAAALNSAWAWYAVVAIEKVLVEENVNPQAAKAWASICLQKKDWKRCLEGIRLLEGQPLYWRAASQEYLDQLDQVLQPLQSYWGMRRYKAQIKAFLRRYRSSIEENTTMRCQIARAYLVSKRHDQAVAAMAGWRQWTDIRPWALSNYAISLAVLRRFDEVFAACRHGLTLPPDAQTPQLHLWMSVEDVLKGDYSSARRRLLIAGEPHQPWHHTVYSLVKGMLAADSARSETKKPPGFWRSTCVLRRSLNPNDRRALLLSPMRQLYHRMLKRLATEHRSTIGYALRRLTS